MEDALAEKTVRDYVCSSCWGNLQRRPADDRQWVVYCPNCGNDQYYVTREYAERRRAESRADATEVNKLLQNLGVLPKPPKRSETDILKDIGF